VSAPAIKRGKPSCRLSFVQKYPLLKIAGRKNHFVVLLPVRIDLSTDPLPIMITGQHAIKHGRGGHESTHALPFNE
jgi:hypothetical protein